MYYDTFSNYTIFDFQNFIDKFYVIILIIEITSLVLALLSSICLWKMFKKANHPVWAGFIPFYNTYILIKMAQLPSWYLLLYFLPFVNIYAIMKTKYEITIRFGYNLGMALLYVFIPIIPMFIFAFKATYKLKTSQEETEKVNLVIDEKLNDFKPVQDQSAVPYEEGLTSYKEEPVPTNVELNIKEEPVIQSNNDETLKQEPPLVSPLINAVPFEEKIEDYAPAVPKTEIVDASLLVEQKPETNINESQKIYIPVGEQIIENVVVPDGTPVYEKIQPIEPIKKVEEKPTIKMCPECGMKVEAESDICFMCGYKFENNKEEML